MIKREKLVSAGAEKLADMILSLYEKNKDIRTELEGMFASLDSDPKKLLTIIKKELSALKRLKKEISYKDEKPLAIRMDNLRTMISNELCEKSPDLAFKLLSEFFELRNETMERILGQGTHISEVFERTCADFVKVSSKFEQPQEDIVKFVFECFMNDEYSLCPNIITDFKDSFNSEGLRLLQEKLKNCPKKGFDVRSGLQQVADCKDDVDAYILASTSNDDLNDKQIIAIVERLIKHNRLTEALSWINRISESSFLAVEATLLKAKIHDLMKDPQKAQDLRVEMFQKNLSTSLYKEIVSHATEDFVRSFKDKAGMQAMQHSKPITALRFLTEVADAKTLSKLVLSRLLHFDGSKDSFIIKPAAEMLRDKDFPISATLLYRRLIVSILEKGRQTAYDHGIRYVQECSNLSKKIDDWGPLQNHKDFVNMLKEKHGKKRSFWSGSGL